PSQPPSPAINACPCAPCVPRQHPCSKCQTARNQGLGYLPPPPNIPLCVTHDIHDTHARMERLKGGPWHGPYEDFARPYTSSNRTISSSPRYPPDCTSISSSGIAPGFSSRCFAPSGMNVDSFSDSR